MATKKRARPEVKPGSSITITRPIPATARAKPWLRVRASQNLAWVAALKRQVPTPDRAWSPVDGSWDVHPDHLPMLRMLALAHFQAAYLVEGVLTTDLVRGVVHRQLSFLLAEEAG
jgi:hypothetical protein